LALGPELNPVGAKYEGVLTTQPYLIGVRVISIPGHDGVSLYVC